MIYRQLLSRASLKLKLTPIIFVIRQYFPQEMLKQLDMDYRSSLIWIQRFMTLIPNR